MGRGVCPCVCEGAGLWGCEGVCVGSIRGCGSSCTEARTKVAVGRTSRCSPPALGPPASAQQWGGLCAPCPPCPTRDPAYRPCGPPRSCTGPGRGRAVASSCRKPWVLPVPGVVLRARTPSFRGPLPFPRSPGRRHRGHHSGPRGCWPRPRARGRGFGALWGSQRQGCRSQAPLRTHWRGGCIRATLRPSPASPDLHVNDEAACPPRRTKQEGRPCPGPGPDLWPVGARGWAGRPRSFGGPSPGALGAGGRTQARLQCGPWQALWRLLGDSNVGTGLEAAGRTCKGQGCQRCLGTPACSPPTPTLMR